MPLPPRGEAAIGQEDVQRDLYLLTPGAWNLVEPDDALDHRFSEVGLKPAFDGDYTRGEGPLRATCGRHYGGEGPALLMVAMAEGPGVSQTSLRAAALISLAKSVDRLDLTQPVLFCYLRRDASPVFDTSPPLPWVAIGDIIEVGTLAGPVLSSAPQPFLGREARGLSSGPDELAGTPADGIERLDYRVIAGHVRAIHRGVLAGLIKVPPPPSPAPPAPPRR